MKTRSVKWVIMAMALLSMAMPFTAKAQDKVEASAGVDLVSGYVWRGQDLGGVSLQPSASIAYKGFSLGAWGSVGIESSDTKEFDLILGYSTGGFSVSVTDYWYNVTGDGVTAKYFQYGVDKDGDRAYSSYISVAAPFTLGGLDWTAEIGATPWATDFYGANGFAVCDVSLGVSKDIKITDSFSLPLFAKATWNPRSEGAYFVVGLSF